MTGSFPLSILEVGKRKAAYECKDWLRDQNDVSLRNLSRYYGSQ
jgi:hypothetical protein